VVLGAATLDNLDTIISTLTKFGQVYGLGLNILKCCLIFPKTLHHRLCSVLSHFVNIPALTSFWKYLGVPIITHKPKIVDYDDLLLRFNKRLAGWQGKYINFT